MFVHMHTYSLSLCDDERRRDCTSNIAATFNTHTPLQTPTATETQPARTNNSFFFFLSFLANMATRCLCVNAFVQNIYVHVWTWPECALVCPQNGEVCISILHPPVDDPQSGELPSERWNPTQNVRYILWRCRTGSESASQLMHGDVSPLLCQATFSTVTWQRSGLGYDFVGRSLPRLCAPVADLLRL